MENKKYPYTATQWHPEKNAFEWGDKLHIPHSRGAIEVTHAGEPHATILPALVFL
jgi:gamma-glutamyl hydrolase